MAFIYHSENGNTLTKSQEELLETIENLQFPFGGISKMKDLRTKTKLRVFVTDREEMLRDWVDYMNQYNALHDEFYWGKHAPACHRHQGEIGERRNFAQRQIRIANEPPEGYQLPLGLYSRTYKWWAGMCRPKVALIMDNVKDYALKTGIDEDIVLGFVFIQEMMHAYFDAFNSEGFPAIGQLEDSFSEFGMLSFINSFSSLRRLFFPFALDYVISKIGKKPDGGGFGIELYKRDDDDAVTLINRYRDISKWTEPPIQYKTDYKRSMEAYEKNPSVENADTVYKYVMGILDLECEPPYDPIQPAIGEKWEFDR